MGPRDRDIGGTTPTTITPMRVTTVGCELLTLSRGHMREKRSTIQPGVSTIIPGRYSGKEPRLTRQAEQQVGINQYNAEHRCGSHLDDVALDLASARPRAGFTPGFGPDSSVGFRSTAHRKTRTHDGFGLGVSQLFSRISAGDSPSWPQETASRQVEDDPEGAYLLATTLLFGQGLERAAWLLHRLDNLTAGWIDGHLWRRRVEFLWATHAERTGDSAGVLDHWRAAEQITGSHCASSTGTCLEPTLIGDLHTLDAVICEQLPLLAIRAYTRLGQTQVAQTLLESHFGGQARAEASQPATLASIACQQGRLGDANRLARAALTAAASPGGLTGLMELEARQVLAEVCLERNELDAAQEHLESAQRHCWSTGAMHSMWAVEADLLRVMIARQQAAAALQRLQGLRRLIDVKRAASPLLHKLNQADIDAHLALGDVEGALQVARTTPAAELPAEAVARLDLCAGLPDRALSRLGSGPGRTLSIEIRQLVVRACADRQHGRSQRAENTMRRALELARSEGYARPFLETPSLTVPLLSRLSNLDPDPYTSNLVDQAERLVAPASLRDSVPMLEPLTDREREVLRHLTSHHNLPQIGAVMCLSTNTIKTHVKAIYRKTGAACRDDAVSIARSHGLL